MIFFKFPTYAPFLTKIKPLLAISGIFWLNAQFNINRRVSAKKNRISDAT
jgi:hypothetical protein